MLDALGRDAAGFAEGSAMGEGWLAPGLHQRPLPEEVGVAMVPPLPLLIKKEKKKKRRKKMILSFLPAFHLPL